MSKKKGRFITLEGLDGSGKDTQLELLKKELEANGKEVVVSSNIDHGPLKESCRNLLTPGNKDFISSYHLSILILCNMAITYKKIKEDVEAGKYVLCSRWYLSSLAYGGRKSDEEFDVILSYIKSLNIDPDLFIFIGTSPEIAMERINSRAGDEERYDDVDKLHQITKRYRDAISSQLANTVIVDGNGTIDEVFEGIKKYIYKIYDDKTTRVYM